MFGAIIEKKISEIDKEVGAFIQVGSVGYNSSINFVIHVNMQLNFATILYKFSKFCNINLCRLSPTCLICI